MLSIQTNEVRSVLVVIPKEVKAIPVVDEKWQNNFTLEKFGNIG